MGYLAPEYVYSGIPTEKTDVYSFGVVVLEVATGRRPKHKPLQACLPEVSVQALVLSFLCSLGCLALGNILY